MDDKTQIPRSALVLGWLGVVPFAAFSTLSITGGFLAPGAATECLFAYGALILSFMGGVHWGFAVNQTQDQQGVKTAGMGARLAISVLPALAAFGLWFVPVITALLGLAIVFLILLAYDISTVRAGYTPDWYGTLRIQLTGSVCVFLFLAVVFGNT